MALRFAVFLSMAWISYMLLDSISRYIIVGIIKGHTVRFLWERNNWETFIFLWNGLIFTLVYIIARHKNIKKSVLIGIIIGLLTEIYIFDKGDMLTIILAPIFYGLLYFISFVIAREKIFT